VGFAQINWTEGTMLDVDVGYWMIQKFDIRFVVSFIQYPKSRI